MVIASDDNPILVAAADSGGFVLASAPVLSGGTAAQIGTPGGLVFNITYDSSVNSAPAGFTAAVSYVANYYSSMFSDPITINLDIGWGEIAGQSLGGALGESETYLDGFSYSQLRSALQSDAKTGDDTTAFASLPASNPTGGNLFVSTAEARA